MKQKIRIAVTGANGFLGSYMVDHLKKNNHWVRAIVRNSYHPLPHLKKADSVYKADLSNLSQTTTALRNIDMVFHFAADMGGVGYFSKEQYYPFVTNMQMDINVVKACETNKVKRLFYPSSACAYPIDSYEKLKKIPKLKENMFVPANPDQMYGWEKLIMILLSQHIPFDIRVGVLHTIFGVGQEWKGKKAKFPPAITYKVIQAKKHGTPIEIWGDGTQLRTFLYISDAVNKIYDVMMAKKYYGPVNISSDEQVTVKQCADWLCEFANIKPHYVFNPNKPTGVIFRGVDNTKFKTHYAYRDQVKTKDGFKQLYSFMTRAIDGK